MILVTGGLGYIGSHTVVELLEAGHEVIILDNLSNSNIEVLGAITEITKKEPILLKGDIRDVSILEQIFETYEIRSVIHFAGLKAVGESVDQPLHYYDNNVGGTITLLRTMASYDVKKIVFSSSATVYGTHPAPFHEELPMHATNPYGMTKMMIEEILGDLYISDPGWGIVLLRYFNPIGAHKTGIIGENPKGIPNNLLPYISRVASGELEKLQVFGDDYDTSDGTGVRDYIHVMDLSEGHVKALSYIEDRTCIEAINLGTGRGYSVLEVIKAFEKASGQTIPYEVVQRRPGDIGTCYAASGKADALLGFRATRDLDEMCEDAWRFTVYKNIERQT